MRDIKGEYLIKSKSDLSQFFKDVEDALDSKGSVLAGIFDSVEEKQKRQRTISQNASLHKYCSVMAGKMNDAGITQRQLVGSFKEGFELPVTDGMIKDIFREVGNALYKKKSTKDLTTVEIQKVYEITDMRFGEITGCREEWPSMDNQVKESLGRKP